MNKSRKPVCPVCGGAGDRPANSLYPSEPCFYCKRTGRISKRRAVQLKRAERRYLLRTTPLQIFPDDFDVEQWLNDGFPDF